MKLEIEYLKLTATMLRNQLMVTCSYLYILAYVRSSVGTAGAS